MGRPEEEGPASTLLVVDDNRVGLQMVGDFLEARGYRVQRASSGEEALRLAARCRPDLVLMDVQMHGMDGLQAIGALRSHPDLAATPVIALTACAMRGDRERCLEAGADEYLSRPVGLKQLEAVIREHLSRKCR